MADERAHLEAMAAMASTIAAALARLSAEAPPAPAPPPVFMTPDEFAARVRLTPRTIRNMTREGLPHVRPRSRTIRIKVAEADAWIASRSASPTRSATLDARKGHLQ